MYTYIAKSSLSAIPHEPRFHPFVAETVTSIWLVNVPTKSKDYTYMKFRPRPIAAINLTLDDVRRVSTKCDNILEFRLESWQFYIFDSASAVRPRNVVEKKKTTTTPTSSGNVLLFYITFISLPQYNAYVILTVTRPPPPRWVIFSCLFYIAA